MPNSSLRCRSALGLLLAVSAMVMPASVQARRSTTVPPSERPAQTEPETAWTAGTAQGDCQRSRRKFWQEGEGWVVRSVTTCR